MEESILQVSSKEKFPQQSFWVERCHTSTSSSTRAYITAPSSHTTFPQAHPILGILESGSVQPRKATFFCYSRKVFSPFFFFESVKCHEGLYVIMLFMTSECFGTNNVLAYACTFIQVFFHLYNSTYVDNLKTLIEHLNMQ